MKRLIVLLAVYAAGLAASEGRSAACGEFWPSLAEITPSERVDSEIWLEPMSGSASARAEAHAISGLWNSGKYGAAIERARGFRRHGDPGKVAVVVGRRNPVVPKPVSRFGTDIRIGTRDSLYGCSFDRSNNGWLFASFPARAGNRTYIYSYRSTDDGATWTELASFSWNYADYVRTTAAVCHGDYLVIAIAIRGLSSHRSFTARLNTTTGDIVPYPGDTVFIQAIESAPDDTIVELAAASSEDQYPGSTIYLFGRTKTGALKYAWTDSSARGWRERSTGIANCDNGLDCSFNEGYTSKYVWASCLVNYSGDSARPLLGYWQAGDTVFRGYMLISAPWAHASNDWVPTAISAYRDTVQVVYLARGLKEVWHNYAVNCESLILRAAPLSDSWVTRDLVETSLRRGGGTAIAYRSHAITERDLLFRHAPQLEGPYTEPDTMSEHMPDPTVRIRVEKIADGDYGMVWVSMNDTPVGAAYFDRVTVPGVAEVRSAQPLRLGLRAQPRPGGVRLEFDNPKFGPVRIRVFDLTGRLVLSRQELLPSGRQAVHVAPEVSGVYFALLEATGERASAVFTFTR